MEVTQAGKGVVGPSDKNCICQFVSQTKITHSVALVFTQVLHLLQCRMGSTAL